MNSHKLEGKGQLKMMHKFFAVLNNMLLEITSLWNESCMFYDQQRGYIVGAVVNECNLPEVFYAITFTRGA